MSKQREKGRKGRSKKAGYKIYQRDGEEMIRENIKTDCGVQKAEMDYVWQ